MTDATGPLEFETLDVDLVDRALAARPESASPVAGPKSSARRERIAYFDTADRRVLRAGRALRVRRRGRKLQVELVALASSSPEHVEDVAAAGGAALKRAPGAVGRRVRLLVGGARLAQIADVRVRESRRTLFEGEAEIGALVLLDAAVPLPGRRRPVRIHRVRFEPAPGVDPARLAGFVAELRAVVDLRDTGRGAIEETLAARGVVAPPAPDLGPTEIAASSSLGEVAYAVLRRQFAVFLAKTPGTRLGDDVEELHDMRVASRRLRAAMPLFRDALPARAEALREELKWVAGALGEVRDLDVQAEQFRAWVVEDPRLAAAAPAPQAREEARERMLAALDSRRCRQFVRAFTAMLRRGPMAVSPTAEAPVVAIAPDLVVARRRKVKKAARGLGRDSPPEAYHELRIRGKRLRYALEFLEEVYGDPARRLADRIAEVQEILGRHQDAYVVIRRVEGVLAAAETRGVTATAAYAMGLLAERCAQEAARLRKRFPRVYARTTGKPWRKVRRAMEALRPSSAAPAAAPEPSESPAPPSPRSGGATAP